MKKLSKQAKKRLEHGFYIAYYAIAIIGIIVVIKES